MACCGLPGSLTGFPGPIGGQLASTLHTIIFPAGMVLGQPNTRKWRVDAEGVFCTAHWAQQNIAIRAQPQSARLEPSLDLGGLVG